MTRVSSPATLLMSLLATPFTGAGVPDRSAFAAGTDWPAYNGTASNSHFSSLAQINRDNVARLKKVWEYHSGDGPAPGGYEFNPLVFDGVMYVATAGGALAALDPATGHEVWRFKPAGPTYNSRGASIWRDPLRLGHARVLFLSGSAAADGDSDLYAIDARTGKAVESFGDHGRVAMGVPVNSPGVIYHNTVILGSAQGKRGDGQVRAYDVRNGKMLWTCRSIPTRGDRGADTWGALGPEKASGANCWGGMTIVEQRGFVYLGTSQPKSEPIGQSFFSGDWQGSNRLSSSVIALNAKTGSLVWDFQETHHDIWDYDLPAPRNLVSIQYQGREIDAVAQVTKRGNTLLLDRDTGALLYPAAEHPAPPSDIPGERASATQPVFSFPEPFAKIAFSEEDVTDLNPAAHAYILKLFKASRTGWFAPPSLQGTIFFGPQGGAEWGGAAFDPYTHLLYVNSNHVPWLVRQRTAADRAGDRPAENGKQLREGEKNYRQYCAACHGVKRKGEGGGASLKGVRAKYSQADIVKIATAGQGRMPAVATNLSDEVREAIAAYLSDVDRDLGAASETGYQPPYVMAPGRVELLDPEGFPGSKPHWGTLNAINLDTGKIEWRVPLGEYPALRARGIPRTGTRNFGGSVVTAGGLLFIAATADEMLRGFDKHTGNVLWEAHLPFGGYATPATYMAKGRQYVVIAAGGGQSDGRPGDAYVAFAVA